MYKKRVILEIELPLWFVAISNIKKRQREKMKTHQTKQNLLYGYKIRLAGLTKRNAPAAKIAAIKELINTLEKELKS